MVRAVDIIPHNVEPPPNDEDAEGASRPACGSNVSGKSLHI